MKRSTTCVIAAVTALGALAMAETPLHAPWHSADAADGEVAIRIFAYQPSPLTVPKGSTVTWTSADDITHTVTSGAPGKKDGRFDGQLAGKGTAYRHTFTEPGTYSYFCGRHQSMTGEIVVK
jgi:plastocyanin